MPVFFERNGLWMPLLCFALAAVIIRCVYRILKQYAWMIWYGFVQNRVLQNSIPLKWHVFEQHLQAKIWTTPSSSGVHSGHIPMWVAKNLAEMWRNWSVRDVFTDSVDLFTIFAISISVYFISKITLYHIIFTTGWLFVYIYISIIMYNYTYNMYIYIYTYTWMYMHTYVE